MAYSVAATPLMPFLINVVSQQGGEGKAPRHRLDRASAASPRSAKHR
jgi:hypothetical protein